MKVMETGGPQLTGQTGEAEEIMAGKSDEWYREQAREQYGSDDIRILDQADVSRQTRGDPGAFVSVWVWVADSETTD